MHPLREHSIQALALLLGFFPLAGHAATVTVAHDPVDCTANLQAALNGTADTIVIPNTGSPWVTGKLYLSRSNVTVRLEPGVELVAKLKGFPKGSDCLLQVQLCGNVNITGYGATFRMLNGIDPAYTSGESRHCLSLRGVDKVLVEGLTFTKAGGDGVYISEGWGGEDPAYSSNVTIQDCVMDDNRRQGVSVISAQNLVIQRCILSNTGVTSGADPMAGIDFEPNGPKQRIANCVVRDCSIFGNNATTTPNGIHTALFNLDSTSQPVTIAIERCHITSTRTTTAAVGLAGPDDDGPTTTLTMKDCLIEDTRREGLHIKSGLSNTTVNVIRTVLRNTFTDSASWGGAPIYLKGQAAGIAAYGNITLTDCLVVDGKPRAFIRTHESRTHLSPVQPNGYCDGLRGNVTVVNPNASGRVWDLDSANDRNITLAITGLSTMPSQTVTATTMGSSAVAEGATGKVEVSRKASERSFPLAVGISWGGTAANRIDYGYHPGFVMLAPDVAATTINIAPRADASAEAERTVVLSLAPRPADYAIESGAATLSLCGEILPPPGRLRVTSP